MTIFRISSAVLMLWSAAAATGAEPPQGVEIAGSNTRVSGDRAIVEVTLRGTSHHTVTAWAYKLEVHYGDGSSRTNEGMVDEISTLLSKNADSTAFRAGATKTFSAVVPLDSRGNAPVSVSPTIEMVAFDDLSAAGDTVQIQRLAKGRRSQASFMSDIIEKVQQARNSPDPKGALKKIIDSQSSQHPGGGPQSFVVLQLLPLLDQGPTALDTALAMYGQYRDLLTQHSALNSAVEVK